MRLLLSLAVVAVIAFGVFSVLSELHFGVESSQVAPYYLENGMEDTGSVNVVTSVVLGYRAFDTLGEVTVLFVAAIGLGALLKTGKELRKRQIEDASLVLRTGCRFLFPMIILFGSYIFIHGHLTPGGGFQGGAIVASGYLLVYLACRGRRVSRFWSGSIETAGGLVFVLIGIAGLTAAGHYFLSNFMPRGTLYKLFSGGIIPVIYVAVGLKVGIELTGVIDNLMEGNA